MNAHTRVDDPELTQRVARGNQSLLELYRIVDSHVEKHQEQGYEQICISLSSGIAPYHPYTERGIRNIGYPSIFSTRYESCTWEKWKGLYIDVEGYIEEREKEEKQLRHKEIDSETVQVNLE